MGRGKSSFIQNNLYEVAKSNNQRILFVIHRKIGVSHFENDISKQHKNDVIQVVTYQHIEAINKNSSIPDFDFSEYDYIVCDEVHYFFDDSWNNFSDLSFKEIISQTDKIRIFMSATGNYVRDYISKELKLNVVEYYFDYDFSFIEHLEFYYNNDALDTYIQNAIDNKNKTIIFLDNTELAYTLYKKYKDHCLFNCAEGNLYYKYVEKDKIDQMIENKMFNQLILITTSVMAEGVDIIDDNLQHIVIDVKDINKMVQCLGRKRLQSSNDTIYLYLKARSNQSLAKMYKYKLNQIKPADYFRLNGAANYINKYFKVNNKAIYNLSVNNDRNLSKLALNEILLFKWKSELKELEYIKEMRCKHKYCEFIKQAFELEEYSIAENEKRLNELNEYLDSMVGKVMLTAKDRQELIEKLNVRNGRNNTLLKGSDTLNGFLRENNLDYYIKQFETSRIVDGKKKKYKSAWKVVKQSEE